MLKKIFCKHKYTLVARRKSHYTSDYIMFSDLGLYDDYLYECEKCGKRKIEVKQNEQHPLYRECVKIGGIR